MPNNGITPAALLVTGTVCAASLIVALALAWRFARTGLLDKDAATLLLALIAAATSLLARTFRTDLDRAR